MATKFDYDRCVELIRHCHRRSVEDRFTIGEQVDAATLNGYSMRNLAANTGLSVATLSQYHRVWRTWRDRRMTGTPTWNVYRLVSQWSTGFLEDMGAVDLIVAAVDGPAKVDELSQQYYRQEMGHALDQAHALAPAVIKETVQAHEVGLILNSLELSRSRLAALQGVSRDQFAALNQRAADITTEMARLAVPKRRAVA